jgi:hypothetical protein
MSLTTLRLKCADLHWKFFSITMFEKAVEHTERRPVYHPFLCVCWRTKICAVAVYGICMGKSCPDALGSFLLTNVDIFLGAFLLLHYFPLHRNEKLICVSTNLSHFSSTTFQNLHLSIHLAKVWCSFARLCELICAVECSRGMRSGLAGKALGYAETRYVPDTNRTLGNNTCLSDETTQLQ